jgi:tRNA (Thr-GGU) A37 N-methylase
VSPKSFTFTAISPAKPVEALEIAKGFVRVSSLDAWPGTPILDLTPEVTEEV